MRLTISVTIGFQGAPTGLRNDRRGVRDLKLPSEMCRDDTGRRGGQDAEDQLRARWHQVPQRAAPEIAAARPAIA